MAHGQWSEVEARGVLEAWRRSGLSVERFAKQRGFVPQRLRWWKVKFAAAEKEVAVSAVSAVSARAVRVMGFNVLLLGVSRFHRRGSNGRRSRGTPPPRPPPRPWSS